MSSAVERSSHLTRRLLAPNPGPMTLDGTNSYVISAPDAAGLVVVDPGPLDSGHLHALAALGHIELVLVTHKHPDHTAGSARFAEISDAPVRALDPDYCVGGKALSDGEQINAGGVRIQVMATPGHTADSVCFVLPDDGPAGSACSGDSAGSVLTGDTILGRGSTVIAHPDSTLGEYLASLDALTALGSALVLPGHGPALPSISAVSEQYRAHRVQRLDEVRAALHALDRGLRPTQGQADAEPEDIAARELLAERVTALVYPDVDPNVRPAALAAVRAQLAHLLN